MTDSATNLEKVIATWHEETRKLLTAKIGSDLQNWNEIDKLCVFVASTSADYCAAIMQLLQEGHEWPAKALMRCLGELDAKFTWCLCGGTKRDRSPAAITERFQRWIKTAYAKGIKLYDEFDSLVPAEGKEQHEKERDKLKEWEKSLTVLNMPALKQVCEQLGNHYSKHISPMFYCRFNSAVHIDPSVLAATYTKHVEGCDVLTRNCLHYAFSINCLIRMQYECQEDFDRIVREYSGITGDD